MAKTDDIFIPSLNESNQDVLKDPEDKIAYLVGFSLINPGLTSELMEPQMVSLSTIVANNQLDMDDAADVYERALQKLISDNCPGDQYTVMVNNIVDPLNDNVSSFEIIVTDGTGENVLKMTHVISQLKLGLQV